MTDPARVTTGAHAWVDPGNTTNTGVDRIDLWVGGLAEKQFVFGGLLGSTFNYVFESQMEDLQFGDRFYYLSRTAGLNMLTQLEGNSFAELIQRNTDVEGLPADSFARPSFIFNLANLGTSGPVPDDPATEWNEAALLTRMPDGTIRYGGPEHVVFNGTAGNNRVWSSEGDDTIRGNDGNDWMQGGDGNDNHIGGLGDDILLDTNGDDTLKGGDGNDTLSSGQGFARRPEPGRSWQRLHRPRRHGRGVRQDLATTGCSAVRRTTRSSATTATTGWRPVRPSPAPVVARSTCCRATTAPRSRTTRTSPATTS